MEAIWNSNPNVNLLFCFADGNCFVKHTEAASYAKEKGMNYEVKQRPTNEEEKENKPTKTNKK